MAEMSLDYARRQIEKAVYVLATSTEPLQKRLAEGWLEGLNALPPSQQDTDMSDDLLSELTDFGNRMKSGGGVESTILKFTEDEAKSAAMEILDLHRHIYKEIINESKSDL